MSPSTPSEPASNPYAPFDTTESIIQSFKSNEFTLILDATSRENEGDLIIAAQGITTSQMAFMIHHTSGLICAPLSSSIAQTLDLPLMVSAGNNTESHGTAYTVSVDAEGTTTGISAEDRARTCRMLAEGQAVPGDFRRPGHVFPLRERVGGLKERQGHTEAAVALCRLAGVREVAVICELVGADEGVEGKAERVGSGMMRREECLEFARRWGLKVGCIEQIVEYLEKSER